MDRVWFNAKYSPKPLVIPCQVKVIRVHEVKKTKLKVPGSAGVIHVLVFFLVLGFLFVKNAKNQFVNNFEG